ncbi:MAG TPA: ABC transporter permease [Dehalococcoidia bacterium]|nr:ABC transporter permease [Dehalococcoidia bacterium]
MTANTAALLPTAADTYALERPPVPAWRAFARSLLKRKLACAALCYIVLFYGTAIFAPAIAPYSYEGSSHDLRKENVLQGPSWKHLFGTDRLGRDLFSRVVYATRTTMLITVATAITGGLFLGVGLGLLAGYRRGIVDSLINRLGEALGSIPALLLLLLLAATVRPRIDAWIRHAYGWPLIGSPLRTGIADITFVFFALTLIGWVDDERLIRSQVLAVRQQEYVLAARSMGASTARILWHHIFPNIRFLVVLGITTSIGAIALSEISLTFFGLGVRAPTPSFGDMIYDGSGPRQVLAHPHLLFVPGTIAILFFISFALFGDALNDILNPRTR